MRCSKGSRLRIGACAGLLAAATLVAGCASTTETEGPLRLEPVTPTILGGAVGADVAPVPVVRVTTAAGRAVAGIPVFFEMAGGGAIATTSVQSPCHRTELASRSRYGGAPGLASRTSQQTAAIRSRSFLERTAQRGARG